jgi:hypothetical protein
MRKGLVIADAFFEATLGTVLVLGALFGDIDSDDFPSPGATPVIALFGAALLVLAVGLMEIAKRERVTDTVLGVLAVGNAAFALLIGVWVVVADGFTSVGETVVWATVAGLMLLAVGQVVALATQSRDETRR